MQWKGAALALGIVSLLVLAGGGAWFLFQPSPKRKLLDAVAALEACMWDARQLALVQKRVHFLVFPAPGSPATLEIREDTDGDGRYQKDADRKVGGRPLSPRGEVICEEGVAWMAFLPSGDLGAYHKSGLEWPMALGWGGSLFNHPFNEDVRLGLAGDGGFHYCLYLNPPSGGIGIQILKSTREETWWERALEKTRSALRRAFGAGS